MPVQLLHYIHRFIGIGWLFLAQGYTTVSPVPRSCVRNAATRSLVVTHSIKTKTKRFDASKVANNNKPARRNNKTKQGPLLSDNKLNSSLSSWRVFGINVHPDALADDQNYSSSSTPNLLHPSVRTALEKRLGCHNHPIQIQGTKVVRCSFDARKKKTAPVYVYTIDVTVLAADKLHVLKHQPGRLERIEPTTTTTMKLLPTNKHQSSSTSSSTTNKTVVIVGAGPAGLFCALELLSAQTQPTTTNGGMALKVILLERGQPVERRGRDIGGLMHRRILNMESNFCFGEGGAGTWSDGKLTTRIGRNSHTVRRVLETLVRYGAPERILIDGAPHLGTDALVRLLRNLRTDLQRMGGEIRFGCKATEILFDKDHSAVKGIVYESLDLAGTVSKQRLDCDSLVLATGHSARDMYESFIKTGIQLEPKGFAVGFRVEHPQRLINEIQYGREWGPSVITGKQRTDLTNQEHFGTLHTGTNDDIPHRGKLPVPSYRLATNNANDGNSVRGVYSFCMCPGGQIVPASTDPTEMCVNGMSFSKRDSQFANSALVVTIDPDDAVLDNYRNQHGVLAGLAFQKDMEQKAAIMGGGNLTVPVQRLTDFIQGISSTSAPPSSYRLSVKPSPCHEIFPPAINIALRDALLNHFEKQMPGFVCDEGLLHGVETRTSSPLRISRDKDTLQAIGVTGLFPAGEGAGFAGGIVSAAVDGMTVSRAVLYHLGATNALEIGDGDFVQSDY